MTLRIVPLASGSQGNATLVESARTRLLIDAGLPVDELEARLVSIGVAPKSVDALFVTHRHHDHIRGATAFADRHHVRIFVTRGTAKALGTEVHRRIKRIVPLEPFTHADLELCAILVEHDAPNTCALRVDDGQCRYGHVTDLGCADGQVGVYLQGCEALLLEFNHDRELLRAGNDPPHLKARILAPTGHLANDDAAALLSRLAGKRLRRLALAHLSRRNNREELALAAAQTALGGRSDVTVVVAKQDVATDGFVVA